MAVVLGLVFEVVRHDDTDVVVSYQTYEIRNYGHPYVEVHQTIPKIEKYNFFKQQTHLHFMIQNKK